MLIGFKTISKLLTELGIFSSQGAKDYEAEVENPYSFWNPLFWQKAPAGSWILRVETCEWIWNEIINSFSTWGDNEDRIYAAFHTMKTQSQLSFFSEWVQTNKKKNLLTWLLGGDIGPFGDRLSAYEISKITDYFKRLPKYKP